MTKWIQRGITVFLLVVLPLFIFYMLGEARFYSIGLDKYYTQIDSSRNDNGVMEYDTMYHTIRSFELTDQDGKSFGSNDLEGKIRVAYFFFTACPTICIEMNERMKHVSEELEKYEDIMIVGHTVDVKRDTVENLARYGRNHNINSKKWKLLTGEQDSIYQMAYHDYKVNAVVDTVSGKVEYVHDDKFILVDKEGIIRGYYDGTDEDDVSRLVTEARQLVKMYRLEKY